MSLQPDSLGSQSSFHGLAGTFDMLTSVDLVSLSIHGVNVFLKSYYKVGNEGKVLNKGCLLFYKFS